MRETDKKTSDTGPGQPRSQLQEPPAERRTGRDRRKGTDRRSGFDRRRDLDQKATVRKNVTRE